MFPPACAKYTPRHSERRASLEILCLNAKESCDDGGRLFPGSGLGLQLLSALTSKPIEPRLAMIFGNAPFRRDTAFLLELQQDGIQRPLVDGKQISADLFDAPRDP